jgi:hypothetical protein
MTKLDIVIIFYEDKIYKIKKQPFENEKQSLTRGWFIVKNNKYNQVETLSKKYLNELNGMKY